MNRYGLLFALALIPFAFSLCATAQSDNSAPGKEPAKKPAGKNADAKPVDANEQKEKSANWSAFEKTDFDLTFEFPLGWAAEPPMAPPGSSLVIGTVIGPRESKNDTIGKSLTVQYSKPMVSKIRDMESPLKASLERVKGYEPIKIDYVQWNGVEALQAEYRSVDRKGNKLRDIMRFAIIYGKYVVVSISAGDANFQKYLPVFEHAVSTLKPKN